MRGDGLKRSTALVRTALKKAEPKPRSGPRQRKCTICRELFSPRSMTHKACSPACAAALVVQQNAKAQRKEDRERRTKLKRRADYFKDAQTALNAWIRLVRDKGKPCISCGRHHQGQSHAGHFLSRGSHPHLALVELNLALQCMPCNVHLSGNQLAFRRGLIERVGLEAVEALEADNTPRKYSIDELVAIKKHYTSETRKSLKGTA